MSKSVLITGVAGFLGHYVVRQFAGAGWRVIGIDDVPQERMPGGNGIFCLRMKLPDLRLAELLRAEAPDVCIHCAGRASVGDSMTEPATDFRDNAVLTFELLEALRRSAPRCRFLFLSSAAVYGNPVALPVTEQDAVQPLSPYGYHKRQAELLCEEYARIFALPALSVRIFSAYGPGLRRQVIWDICAKLLKTGRLQLHGTGAESRDFIHAADIALGLHLLAEKAPAQGEVYNLASGREVTIRELAAMIATALGSNRSTEFDGVSPAGNPLNWRADLTRISTLGFQPAISLETGIAEVAQWCRKELSGECLDAR